MNPIIITIADRHVGRADFPRITNDSLNDLQNALLRNASADCDQTVAQLTTQVLKIAESNLRDSHIFVGRLADNTELHFIGRVPPGMTPEFISRSVFKKECA